jgi:hypothetical protein
MYVWMGEMWKNRKVGSYSIVLYYLATLAVTTATSSSSRSLDPTSSMNIHDSPARAAVCTLFMPGKI